MINNSQTFSSQSKSIIDSTVVPFKFCIDYTLNPATDNQSNSKVPHTIETAEKSTAEFGARPTRDDRLVIGSAHKLGTGIGYGAN